MQLPKMLLVFVGVLALLTTGSPDQAQSKSRSASKKSTATQGGVKPITDPATEAKTEQKSNIVPAAANAKGPKDITDPAGTPASKK